MKVYTAHLVIIHEPLDVSPESFLVHENILLVSANSPEEATEIAERCGKQYESSLSEGLTIEDCEVRVRFCGVRKLISSYGHCFHSDGSVVPLDIEDLVSMRAASACEISFSTYYVRTIDEAMRLGAGESILLDYDE